MSYISDEKRYDGVPYRRCGRSGIVLPPISLGLWQNFGGINVFEIGRAVIRRAFDRGVTHFDLANNYGPPYGSAEENLTRVRALNEIANGRGQSLPQMAIAWVLRDKRVTSALIGARNVEQLDNSLDALKQLEFSEAELTEIDRYAQEASIDLWKDAREGRE